MTFKTVGRSIINYASHVWSTNIQLRKRHNHDETRQPAQLRSGYCKLLGSYTSRIKKDASLNICVDCLKTPHDEKHLFACPAHPTTLIPSNLWIKLLDSIREFSYLEGGGGTQTETNQALRRTTTTTDVNNNTSNTLEAK